MLCLRCSKALSALPKVAPSGNAAVQASSKRTFTSLATLRPTLNSSFRPSSNTIGPSSSILAEAMPSANELAILPFKPTQHPAMAAMQIRCAPRNTFNPSHFVRKRRHGFLSRSKTRTGRMILRRRRAKGRTTLSH